MRRVLFSAALGAALLAGCGGDDGPGGPEGEVKKVVQVFIEDEENDTLCGNRNLVTPRLTNAIFGSESECRSDARKQDAEDKRDKEEDEAFFKAFGDGKAEVGDIEVRGSTGSAVVTFSAEKAGLRISGPLEVRRTEDGWRIDDLSVTFLRSFASEVVQFGLKAGLDEVGKDAGAGKELERATQDKELGRCFADRLPRSDAAMRRYGYTLFRYDAFEGDGFKRQLGCLGSTRSGRLAVRLLFEAGLRQGGPRRLGDCVVAALRKTLPSRELAPYALKLFFSEGEPDPPAAMQRKINAAIAGCASEAGGGDETFS